MKGLVALLLAAVLPAAAQDYDRERRWAAEVVPNLVVGDAVTLRVPQGREFLGVYADALPTRPAFLLVHGIGVHPDHGVIGVLRTALHEAGFSTLSIQMPVQRSDATLEDYDPKLFPEAVQRIGAGVTWLRARGFPKIVLLSHSLGSRMSGAYLESTADPGVVAWISLGLSGGFGALDRLKRPVLDVFGEHDLPAVLKGEAERRAALEAIAGSRQVRIAGADHFYSGREKALETAIRDFVGTLE